LAFVLKLLLRIDMMSMERELEDAKLTPLRGDQE